MNFIDLLKDIALSFQNGQVEEEFAQICHDCSGYVILHAFNTKKAKWKKQQQQTNHSYIN